MGVYLFRELENDGPMLTISGDIPALPPGWDSGAVSCSIDHWSIPCYFYSEPNYLGSRLKLTQGGGCDDLDLLPGRWRNKIRSVALAKPQANTEDEFEAKLVNQAMEGISTDPESINLLTTLDNPLIADAGCIFNDGRRSASFRYGSYGPPIGTKLKIAVLNPTYNQYCTNGRPARMEDVSLEVESWSVDSNNPFAQLTIAGFRWTP